MMAVITLALVMLFPLMSQWQTANQPTQPEAVVSPYLQALQYQRSALVRVDGGVYFRGTMPEEAAQSTALCDQNGWQCDLSLAEDSYPPHRLRVDGFWMEMHEVSYGQYVTFLNTIGLHTSGCYGQLCALTEQEDPTSSIIMNGNRYITTNPAINDYPVVDVTWYGAAAYCESMGRRLPTEAEWEYAARGASGTLFPWGDAWDAEAANVRGTRQTSDGVVIAGPQPVSGYPAYASYDGVRDLAGNVAEWVADWYASDHYLRLDPTTERDSGPSEGTEKVIRGGSWNDVLFFARAVHRDHRPPEATSNTIGFRCVAD